MNAYDEGTMVTPAQRSKMMYGCDINEFRESLEDSITFKLTGPAMCAMSLMSDAQEEMAMGMTESARQTINRAKWVIGTYIMKDRV
jgi:hypothetical protein